VSKHPIITDLSAFFEYHLPIFDEILAKAHTPLRQRPFAATIKFVAYCIVEIKGDTKEKAFEKPWFKSFYHQISDWYSEKYGEAMKSDSTDFTALGVLLIYDTPFRIEIPLSVTGERVSQTSGWFCMPNSILEHENVFDWITCPPNFKKMSAEERSFLEADLRAIAEAIRSLRINLMTATIESDALQNLADSIPSHVEKAANDILSLSQAGISSSFWELHLAMEKSLKLLLRQKGSTAPNIHVLKDLCDKANRMTGVSIDISLLSNVASHKDAICHRYGEANEITLEEAILNYKNSLVVVRNVTETLSREIIMDNAKVLLRLPPHLC